MSQKILDNFKKMPAQKPSTMKCHQNNLLRCQVVLEDIMLRGRLKTNNNIKHEQEVENLIILPAVKKLCVARNVKEEKADDNKATDVANFEENSSSFDDSDDSFHDEDQDFIPKVLSRLQKIVDSNGQSKTDLCQSSDNSSSIKSNADDKLGKTDGEINKNVKESEPIGKEGTTSCKSKPVKHEADAEYIITLAAKSIALQPSKRDDDDVILVNFDPACRPIGSRSSKVAKFIKRRRSKPTDTKKPSSYLQQSKKSTKSAATRPSVKSTRTYICDYDGKIFKKKGKLYYHILSHMLKIPCTICHAMLKPCSMKEHVRDFHAKGRKFKCSKCSMTFKAAKDVNRHEKNHFKKFKCQKCPKKFRLQYDLNKHIQHFHDNPRSFECDHCDLKFYEKVVLKRHLWLHAKIPKVKHLKCQICGYATHDKQVYNRHLSFHEMIKSCSINVNNKYKCKKCSKVCGNLKSFTSHYGHKHRKSNYVCDYCGRNYKIKKKFSNHVRECCRNANAREIIED